MESEYTKEKKRMDREKGGDADRRELSAKMSEAEALDLYKIDADTLADEITTAEVRALVEIPPTEILKFTPRRDITATSPVFYSYLQFVRGLSLLASATISGADSSHVHISASKKSGEVPASFRADSTAHEYQKYWISVLKGLHKTKNISASLAIARGIRKTRASPMLLEEVAMAERALAPHASHEAQSLLQKAGELYVRDAEEIEKCLIDAASNPQDKRSAQKFYSVVEYLKYIRKHADRPLDKKINHKIITLASQARDLQLQTLDRGAVQYEGSFLFLEYSNFLRTE